MQFHRAGGSGSSVVDKNACPGAIPTRLAGDAVVECFHIQRCSVRGVQSEQTAPDRGRAAADPVVVQRCRDASPGRRHGDTGLARSRGHLQFAGFEACRARARITDRDMAAIEVELVQVQPDSAVEPAVVVCGHNGVPEYRAKAIRGAQGQALVDHAGTGGDGCVGCDQDLVAVAGVINAGLQDAGARCGAGPGEGGGTGRCRQQRQDQQGDGGRQDSQQGHGGSPRAGGVFPTIGKSPKNWPPDPQIHSPRRPLRHRAALRRPRFEPMFGMMRPGRTSSGTTFHEAFPE